MHLHWIDMLETHRKSKEIAPPSVRFEPYSIKHTKNRIKPLLARRHLEDCKLLHDGNSASDVTNHLPEERKEDCNALYSPLLPSVNNIQNKSKDGWNKSEKQLSHTFDHMSYSPQAHQRTKRKIKDEENALVSPTYNPFRQSSEKHTNFKSLSSLSAKKSECNDNISRKWHSQSIHKHFLPILDRKAATICHSVAKCCKVLSATTEQQTPHSFALKNTKNFPCRCTRMKIRHLPKRFLFTLLLSLLFIPCTFSRPHKQSHTPRGPRSINFDVDNLKRMSEYLAYPLMVNSKSEQRPSRWLYPSVVNLATQAFISANSTCGLRGEVKYCKLVEHVDRRTSRRRSRQCSMCNAYSRLPSQRHFINYATDGRGDTWWQSSTIEQGYDHHWVTITLDLRQIFQIAYVIVKAANSPRPGNWILEKSLDGVTWYPWQYFAVSDSDCFKEYGLPPAMPGPPKYRTDTEVMCTSYFSRLIPLQNGEIHVSLMNGRPSAENPSPELVSFTSARFVRLRLQRIRTLHGDLMTLSFSSPEYADPYVTRRYYYSIKDISIGGMCICYGHASTCPAEPETGGFSCDCEHHTAGPNCETCSPGYRQYEWQPGNNGFQCEACNCHGHADDCFFDSEVAEKEQSLNIHGDYSGGGVCIGCRDHTAGINCETCTDGYYRPFELDADARNPCARCVCDPHGSARLRGDSGPYVCVKDVTFIDVEKNLFPGYCYCKPGFTGKRCDSCAIGFHNYPFCDPCPCNISGSLNTDVCAGECVCKENVIGSSCSQCKQGYYNLKKQNPAGCDVCYCSGVTQSCQSSELKWSSVQTNQGWEVRDKRGRRSSPAQVDPDFGEPYVEHGQAAREVGTTMYYWSAPREYLGERLSSYGGYLRYVVSYDILQGQAPLPIQDADVILEGNGRSLIYNYQGMLADPLEEKEASLRLAPNGDRFGWVDAVTHQPINKMEMMVVLQRVTRLLIRAVYSRNNGAVYRIRDVYFDVATLTGSGGLASSVEMCHCPSGYTGLSCEGCKDGYWRNGKYCVPCQCNGHTTVCNKLNGVCETCLYNTMGTHCERCKPGYYGDATWGTSRDCQRCSCPLPIASNNFSPTCQLDRTNGDMLCLACPIGYAGQRCQFCSDGYFGQPASPGGTCQPCQCNGNSNTCDRVTGQCTLCQGHTAGDHCERCEAAYYGDAIDRKDCVACECHPIGSKSRQCDSSTGQCLCAHGVYGRRCDACEKNHYLNKEARMCVSCDCQRAGSMTMQCTSEGTCICKTGVKGQFCDSCESGYYGFSRYGCNACNCPRTNGNCDAQTGRCICPPNTQGNGCKECSFGTYNWHSDTGCTNCDCNQIGSLTYFPCNNITGQCPCKSKYGGLQCNQCSDGFFGFPSCRSCRCNKDGSNPMTCSGSTCRCSDRGLCFCKENVVGVMCDRCAVGSFGLSALNHFGCTNCYCSGVTDRCTQAPYVWGPPISLDSTSDASNSVNASSQAEKVFFNRNVLSTITDDVVPSYNSKPYYWRLPQKFRGDMTMSYGGTLRYAIQYLSEATGTSEIKPVSGVVLRGGDQSVRTVQYQSEGMITAQTQTFTIPMREFSWMDVENGLNVTRAEFSDILKNLHFVLVKSSFGYLMSQPRLRDVFLDLAIPGMEGRGDSGSLYPLAVGVEQCACPLGYSGLSCEKCSSGYMRVEQREGVTRCQRCHCNNRSNTCIMETGECLNCEEKFSGKHCETCIPGYYMSRDTCTKCACPGNAASNNFSPTCHNDGNNGFICDACLPGYEGKHCERCSDGYYGDPTSPGRLCLKCGCNVAGSVDALCDKETGQCHCDVGIRGRVCDQCQPSHVITPRGCTRCDGECIETLLNDVEQLTNSTKYIVVQNTIPLPWRRLFVARNITVALQENASLSSAIVNNALNHLRSLNVSDINNDVSMLVSKAATCFVDAREFSSAIDSSKRAVRNKTRRARSILSSVEGFSQSITGLLTQLLNGASENIAIMHDRANGWINEMRSLDISPYLGIAQDDMVLSKEMKARILKNFTETIMETQKLILKEERLLEDRYSTLFSKLNDTKIKFFHVNVIVNVTNKMNRLNRQYHRQNEGDTVRVKNIATMTEVILEKGNKIFQRAKKSYSDGRRYMDMLSSEDLVKSSLRNATTEMKLLLKNGLNPAPRDLMMIVKNVVEDHKKNLQSTANYIKQVHQNISHHSSNQTEAASRWTNIANQLKEANKTSNLAYYRAEDAGSVTNSHLHNKIQASIRQTKKVYSGAAAVRITINGDGDHLQKLKNELRSVNHSARELHRKHDKILSRIKRTRLGFLSPESVVTSEDVHRAALRSSPILADVEDGISMLQQTYQQLDVANRNALKYNSTLTDVSDKLSQIPRTLKGAVAASDSARYTAKRLELISEEVSKNISHIRKLIEDARRKAASYRQVSVKSTGSCAMQYKPELTPGKTTEIILNVKTNSPDNMLFYLARKKEDYIAVELRDSRVTVTWDLGGGAGFVQNPLRVVSKGEPAWFRIEIVRINQNLNVTVYRVSNKSETIQTSSGSSPGNFEMLNVGSNDLMFVGGVFNAIETQGPVVYRTFTGCMGEAFLQGKSVGLWNFKKIQNRKECSACSASVPVNQGQLQANVYSYDGESYTVLKLPLNQFTENTKFRLKFQTFASEGLLFYIGSKEQPDFLSLEIYDDRLFVKMDLGDGVHSESTTENYNSGQWVFVDVVRQGNYVRLETKINGALQEQVTLDIATSTDNRLNLKKNDNLFVGGYPSENDIKSNVTRIPLVGCIQEFAFSGRLRYLKPNGLQDKVEDSGVSFSCPDKITRDVSIVDAGYIELSPIDLPSSGSITITFNTREPDALLLLATSEDEGRRSTRQSNLKYFTIYITDGRVHSRIFPGEEDPLLLSSRNNFYNNGGAHSITLRRQGANISLHMNEGEDHVSGLLTHHVRQPIMVRHLFVGGVPLEYNVQEITGVRKSLNGCLRDLMVINHMVNFKRALKAKNTFFGTCKFVHFDMDPPVTSLAPPLPNYSVALDFPNSSPSMKDGEIITVSPTPTTNHPLCKPSRPGKFSYRASSVHFGLTPNSHLMFKLKDPIERKFTFEVRLKTLGSSGLILYCGQNTQQDFFALKLKDGIPLFQFNNGRGVAEEYAQKPINDGKWHRIRIKRTKRRGVLVVDKQKKKNFLARKGSIHLNVNNDLYVGGLPIGHDTSRVGQISNSMDVCIKRLTFNKGTKLKPCEAASSYEVQQCYKRTVHGAYFIGKGLAVFDSKYRVGPNMLIELEFRTWRAHGVLISVDSKRLDGLALEMINGTLFFRTNNGAGSFEISFVSPELSRHGKVVHQLGDGKWHRIRAEKNMGTLRLSVDGKVVPEVTSGASTFSADTNDPLFIGGIPRNDEIPRQIQTTESFEGCLRNMRLKDVNVAFDEIHRQNVFPSSCPIAKKRSRWKT